MTDDQESQVGADTEEDETLFAFRMVRVVDELGAIINENRFRLFEADAVLPGIGGSLFFIPLEA